MNTVQEERSMEDIGTANQRIEKSQLKTATMVSSSKLDQEGIPEGIDSTVLHIQILE